MPISGRYYPDSMGDFTWIHPFMGDSGVINLTASSTLNISANIIYFSNPLILERPYSFSATGFALNNASSTVTGKIGYYKAGDYGTPQFGMFGDGVGPAINWTNEGLEKLGITKITYAHDEFTFQPGVYFPFIMADTGCQIIAIRSRSAPWIPVDNTSSGYMATGMTLGVPDGDPPGEIVANIVYNQIDSFPFIVTKITPTAQPLGDPSEDDIEDDLL